MLFDIFSELLDTRTLEHLKHKGQFIYKGMKVILSHKTLNKYACFNRDVLFKMNRAIIYYYIILKYLAFKKSNIICLKISIALKTNQIEYIYKLMNKFSASI